MFTVPQHCLLWESCTQGNYNLDSHLRGARWERLRVGWASPGHLCEVGALYFLLLSFNARNRKPCQDKLHLKNKTNKKTRMYRFISLEPRARTDLIQKPNRAQEGISVVLLPSLHILDVGFNFRCIPLCCPKMAASKCLVVCFLLWVCQGREKSTCYHFLAKSSWFTLIVPI